MHTWPLSSVVLEFCNKSTKKLPKLANTSVRNSWMKAFVQMASKDKNLVQQ